MKSQRPDHRPGRGHLRGSYAAELPLLGRMRSWTVPVTGPRTSRAAAKRLPSACAAAAEGRRLEYVREVRTSVNDSAPGARLWLVGGRNV